MDRYLARRTHSHLHGRDAAARLYLRDDQAVAPEHFLGRHAVAGVTFGWSDEQHEAMLRIIWLKKHGGKVWSFDDLFDNDAALLAMPQLRRELEALARTADCDELVGALERLGFRNGRKASLADYL